MQVTLLAVLNVCAISIDLGLEAQAVAPVRLRRRGEPESGNSLEPPLVSPSLEFTKTRAELKESRPDSKVEEYTGLQLGEVWKNIEDFSPRVRWRVKRGSSESQSGSSSSAGGGSSSASGKSKEDSGSSGQGSRGGVSAHFRGGMAPQRKTPPQPSSRRHSSRRHSAQKPRPPSQPLTASRRHFSTTRPPVVTKAADVVKTVAANSPSPKPPTVTTTPFRTTAEIQTTSKAGGGSGTTKPSEMEESSPSPAADSVLCPPGMVCAERHLLTVRARNRYEVLSQIIALMTAHVLAFTAVDRINANQPPVCFAVEDFSGRALVLRFIGGAKVTLEVNSTQEPFSIDGITYESQVFEGFGQIRLSVDPIDIGSFSLLAIQPQGASNFTVYPPMEQASFFINIPARDMKKPLNHMNIGLGPPDLIG